MADFNILDGRKIIDIRATRPLSSAIIDPAGAGLRIQQIIFDWLSAEVVTDGTAGNRKIGITVQTTGYSVLWKVVSEVEQPPSTTYTYNFVPDNSFRTNVVAGNTIVIGTPQIRLTKDLILQVFDANGVVGGTVYMSYAYSDYADI